MTTTTMTQQGRHNAIYRQGSHQWARVHALMQQFEEDHAGCALHPITTDATHEDAEVLHILIPHQRLASAYYTTYAQSLEEDTHDLHSSVRALIVRDTEA